MKLTVQSVGVVLNFEFIDGAAIEVLKLHEKILIELNFEQR